MRGDTGALKRMQHQDRRLDRAGRTLKHRLDRTKRNVSWAKRASPPPPPSVPLFSAVVAANGFCASPERFAREHGCVDTAWHRLVGTGTAQQPPSAGFAATLVDYRSARHVLVAMTRAGATIADAGVLRGQNATAHVSPERVLLLTTEPDRPLTLGGETGTHLYLRRVVVCDEGDPCDGAELLYMAVEAGRESSPPHALHLNCAMYMSVQNAAARLLGCELDPL